MANATAGCKDLTWCDGVDLQAALKFTWPPECPPLATTRDRACVELIGVNVANRDYDVDVTSATHIVNIAYLQGDGRRIDLADTMAVAPSDPGLQAGGCHALQTWLSSDACCLPASVAGPCAPSARSTRR